MFFFSQTFLLYRDSQSISSSIQSSLHNFFYSTSHFSTLLSLLPAFNLILDSHLTINAILWLWVCEIRLKDISSVPCFHFSSQLIFAAASFCVVILSFWFYFAPALKKKKKKRVILCTLFLSCFHPLSLVLPCYNSINNKKKKKKGELFPSVF